MNYNNGNTSDREHFRQEHLTGNTSDREPFRQEHFRRGTLQTGILQTGNNSDRNFFKELYCKIYIKIQT
jgi:hypothetical protein